MVRSGKKIPTIGFGAGTAWYGRSGVDPELRDAVCKAHYCSAFLLRSADHPGPQHAYERMEQ